MADYRMAFSIEDVTDDYGNQWSMLMRDGQRIGAIMNWQPDYSPRSNFDYPFVHDPYFDLRLTLRWTPEPKEPARPVRRKWSTAMGLRKPK